MKTKTPKLTDASRANKSGQDLEKKLKNFLVQNEFIYKQQKPRSPEIDFIIGNGKETIYADCTNQNVEGSVDEKIPHKIWKYHKKYGYSDVYIIRGKHMPNESVIQHCDHICKDNNFKMHLVTFEEFCAILLKKQFVSPLEQFFMNNEETHVNT